MTRRHERPASAGLSSCTRARRHAVAPARATRRRRCLAFVKRESRTPTPASSSSSCRTAAAPPPRSTHASARSIQRVCRSARATASRPSAAALAKSPRCAAIFAATGIHENPRVESSAANASRRLSPTRRPRRAAPDGTSASARSPALARETIYGARVFEVLAEPRSTASAATASSGEELDVPEHAAEQWRAPVDPSSS